MKKIFLFVLCIVSICAINAQSKQEFNKVIVAGGKTIICKVVKETAIYVVYKTPNDNTERKMMQEDIDRIVDREQYEQSMQNSAVIGDDEKQYVSRPLRTFRDSVDFQLDYMRACMNKHTTQFYTGYALNAAGTIFMLVGASSMLSQTNKIVKDYSKAYTLMTIGGIMSAVGTITIISSHRWFRKASICPMPGHIYFRVEF